MGLTAITNAAQVAEDHAHRCLGKLFVVFASIEFKLALSLGNTLADMQIEWPGGIKKMTFQEKLENFLHANVMNNGRDDVRYRQCFDWYRVADSIREARNRFAHGRWAFLAKEPHIVHVAGYPDGKQDELRLSLADLDDLVEAAVSVNEELASFISEGG